MYPDADIYADLEDEATLPDMKFDCIVATQVIMYMYDIERCMRNLRRMLKPGGMLILTVPGFAAHRQGHVMMATFTEDFLKQLCMSTFGNHDNFRYYGNLEYVLYMLFGVKKNPYEKPTVNEYKYSLVLGITARNTD